MTVEIVEPGVSTVVEATVDTPVVLEVHAVDPAVVEVTEPDSTGAVEVLIEAPAVVEVVSPDDLIPSVEVVETPSAVVEVVAPTAGSQGLLVTWDGVRDKPETFPPSPHTHLSEEITDLSTSVQMLLDEHINSPTPHPAYDNISPSLVLLYENGLI